jgi:hypothetical protein
MKTDQISVALHTILKQIHINAHLNKFVHHLSININSVTKQTNHVSSSSVHTLNVVQIHRYGYIHIYSDVDDLFSGEKNKPNISCFTHNPQTNTYKYSLKRVCASSKHKHKLSN